MQTQKNSLPEILRLGVQTTAVTMLSLGQVPTPAKVKAIAYHTLLFTLYTADESNGTAVLN